MTSPFLRLSWRAACATCCSCFFFFVALGAKVFQEQAPTAAHSSSNESREQGPPQRIPRQQAQNTAALDGQVRETNSLGNPLPIPGVVLTLRNLQSAQTFMATSSAEGIFRLFPLPPGKYELHAEAQGYAPFNRNRWKSDEPIWPERLGQQVFLNLTASAETFFDGRRLPSPSNVSSARAGSPDFFGKGEQAFFDQTLRFALDMFHGDASFKPVDWRIRVTPEFSLNDLKVRELGIVVPDVRSGTNRFDNHVGLQEASVEVKLHEL